MENQTILKLSVHNSCYARGCHFPEDDWTLEGEGKTFEEAMANLIHSNEKSLIVSCYPDGVYATEIDIVDLNGERFYAKNERDFPYTQENLEKYGFPSVQISSWIQKESDIKDLIRRHVKDTISKGFLNHPYRLHLRKVNDRLKRFNDYLAEKAHLNAERKKYEELAKKFGGNS